jgi:hypothetical protein
MRLKSILHDQANRWEEMGGSPSEAISAIAVYRKSIARRLIIQWLLFFMLLGGGIYASFSFFTEQKVLASLVAAFIGIAAGLITNLFGTWRELDYSNLVLMLIREADDAQIKTIIGKLVEKL